MTASSNALQKKSKITTRLRLRIDFSRYHKPAEIPNLIGPGGTAQMTYYETPAGARVFAAGAFTLAGARDPLSRRLLENLWRHLAVRSACHGELRCSLGAQPSAR